MFKLRLGGSYKHISQKKCMISPSTVGSNFETAFWIPSKITINKVKFSLVVDVSESKVFEKIISGWLHCNIVLIPFDHVLRQMVFNYSWVFSQSLSFLAWVGTQGSIGAYKWLFSKYVDWLSEHKSILIDGGDAEYNKNYLGLKTTLLGTIPAALMALRWGSIE